MSDTTTRGIRVQVTSAYLPERSVPAEQQYLFTYRVRISNTGLETAQLVSREWIITDSDGNEQRILGPGVVGEQPVLAPGADFEYLELLPLEDTRRLHARVVSDGHPDWRDVRCGDCTLHPGRAERGQLNGRVHREIEKSEEFKRKVRRCRWIDISDLPVIDLCDLRCDWPPSAPCLR